jgi:hypothetical protein
MKYCKYH